MSIVADAAIDSCDVIHGVKKPCLVKLHTCTYLYQMGLARVPCIAEKIAQWGVVEGLTCIQHKGEPSALFILKPCMSAIFVLHKRDS